MKKFGIKSGAVCMLIALTATLMAVEARENISVKRLSVSFSFSKTKRGSRVSPEIRVGNIPDDTKYLKVRMVDLDKPTYNHGGGKVKYRGSGTIPAGALKSWRGPNPPGDSVHSYQFTVKSINSKGQVTGIGKAVRKFP